jgi:hypothetical protein
MSLINDALKKAQNQRTGHLADAAPMPGGGSGANRGQRGMPTGMLVLLIAGAVVVVIISVVATVYFVNRPATPKSTPPVIVSTQPVAAPAVSNGPALPAPALVAPAPTAPGAVSSASQSVAAAAAPAAALATPSPIIIAPVIVKATPPPVEPPAAPPAAVEEPAAAAATPAAEPVVEGSLEDRINAFVDKVRVTGIRTSDSGSKVLMNDHVYRVNDLVDRKLGLKLVKIAPDSLTFADAKGATYVKSF